MLIDPIVTARLPEIVTLVAEATVNGKYQHWDTIRHKSPPGDISRLEWWLGLKFHRRSAARRLDFRDKADNLFTFTLVDPIPERLHRIDLSTGGNLDLPPEIANTEHRDRYCVSSLMEEAITSSQLEGASTTSQVARELLSTERKPLDRSEQMILNNFVTMRKIDTIKDRPLTKELILDIHRWITHDTLDNPNAAGRFRTLEDGPVYVQDKLSGEIRHNPPPPDTLEERVSILCDFANGKTPDGFVHPVLRAIIIHFMLGYDHPFVDGNGRTARALFYWAMLHNGYWLFEFIAISAILKKSPGKYAMAFLHTENDENDLTYFILHQLAVIDRAINELHAYIARKTQQQRDVEQRLRGQVPLNHRQIALLSHAIRHPLHQYSVTSHQTRHNVVYETARTDLAELAERGLLIKSKVGKTFYFAPVTNLEKSLERLGASGA